MRLIELKVSGFQRVRAAHIRPDGHVVTISGRNDQGKTSLLRAIWVLLEGLAAAPAKLIRLGAEECRLYGDFGEIKVERTFTRSGDGNEMTHTLRVTDGEGKPIKKKQQGTLDALLGAFAFDPLAFARAPAKEQYDLLKRLVPGVDFDAIANRRQKLYEDRTEANRIAAREKAAADTIQLPPGSCPKDVDVSKETAALTEANAKNTAAGQEKARRDRILADILASEERWREKCAEVERLRKQADAIEAEAVKMESSFRTARTEAADLAPIPAPIDTAPIIAKITDAGRVKEIRTKFAERGRHLDAAEESEATAADLTRKIEALDDEKAKAIAAAKMPVEGLGFGDNEILLNGIPFSQAGTRVKIMTSAMIAMALNPELRVMTIDEGSEIDAEGLTLLEKLAEQKDYTVILARVDEHARSGFLMEDGTLTSISDVAAE